MADPTIDPLRTRTGKINYGGENVTPPRIIAPSQAVAAPAAVPWESNGNLGGVSAIPMYTPPRAPAAPVDPYAAANRMATDAVTMQARGTSTPEPSGLAAPGTARRVIQPAAEVAASNMDPMGNATGANPTTPSAEQAFPGLARVSEEAGGGARGAGAVARDVYSNVMGGVIAPVVHGAKAVKEAAGVVGDFAGGFAGSPAAAAPAADPANPASAPTARAPVTVPLTKPVAAPAAAPAAAPVASTLPPGVTRVGNTFSNAGAAPAPASGPITPAPAGAGYSGTPGFTADGGNVSGSAGVSAALKAAADRGDTDAIAAHYQRDGGTFNGTTAAQDNVARLNKSVNMATPGGAVQKSRVAQRDAAVAQGSAAQAADLAKTKVGAEVAQAKAATAKAGAETANLQLTNQQKTRINQMIDQISNLDATSDPDGSKRLALKDSLLAVMHGKDTTEHQFQAIDIPTGTENPLTNAPNVIKGVFDKRAGKVVDTGKPGASKVPAGMKQVGTSGGKPVYQDKNGRQFIDTGA